MTGYEWAAIIVALAFAFIFVCAGIKSPARGEVMRSSMSGCLKNAADCMEEMAALLREIHRDDCPSDVDPEPGDHDGTGQADYHVFCLREMAKNADDVATGEHSLVDFAEVYCLVSPAVADFLKEAVKVAVGIAEG